MAEYMNRLYGIDVRITKVRVKAAGGSTSRRNTGVQVYVPLMKYIICGGSLLAGIKAGCRSKQRPVVETRPKMEHMRP